MIILLSLSRLMISGSQIRMARAALRWSIKDLAKCSGVSVPTIFRLEQEDGLPSSRSQTLMDLKNTFEAAGIEFIGTPDNGAGVRLNREDN